MVKVTFVDVQQWWCQTNARPNSATRWLTVGCVRCAGLRVAADSKDAHNLETVFYEGTGPGGSAFMVRSIPLSLGAATPPWPHMRRCFVFPYTHASLHVLWVSFFFPPPSSLALLQVECLTDKRTRTGPAMRHIFTKVCVCRCARVQALLCVLPLVFES